MFLRMVGEYGPRLTKPQDVTLASETEKLKAFPSDKLDVANLFK